MPPTGDAGTLPAPPAEALGDGEIVTVERMVVGMQVLTVITEVSGAGLLAAGDAEAEPAGAAGEAGALPAGAAGEAGALPAGEAGLLDPAGEAGALLPPAGTPGAGLPLADEAGAGLGAGAPPRTAVTGQIVVYSGETEVTTTVEAAGQLVTVGPQLVIVISVLV